MKEFLLYSVLRLSLFLATWAVLLFLATWLWGSDNAAWLWTLLVAAVVSSLLSLRLLESPRERLAGKLEARSQVAHERRRRVKEILQEDPAPEKATEEPAADSDDE